ncbi:retinal-specific phospholipid-transporting ATPase ABCA4-like [Ornithodoros turicata]|uniref:retinal-specific phospholipid-transporting ATPase ABCA4-like n=1 Tax=Ornithodoros turicata TaxID=34597 RepID=UPI0031398C38
MVECLVQLRQLYVILWKNIFINRIRCHYFTTVLEIALMVALMSGIQRDAVMQEPFIRHPDTLYPPAPTSKYWMTQKNISNIDTVIFFPDTKYFARLVLFAATDLGIRSVIGMKTKPYFEAIIKNHMNSTPSTLIGVLFDGHSGPDPVALNIHIYPTKLPLDYNVRYGQRLGTQPPGPNNEAKYGETNTILPIMSRIEWYHLLMVAERRNISFRQQFQMRRFPYPAYIEEQDTKNYGLVLTRFCVGMLIPFALFVSKLTDERGTGMKEMLRLIGLSDRIYWISHFLSAFYVLLIIVTLMMLFLTVKKNAEGRRLIQYSDPLLLFYVLLSFCSSCLLHAMLLSVFFYSPASAVAGSMLYWTFSCVMPFMLLENPSGRGYYYISRSEKMWTSIFPGMNLHWCFRVLERFEKYVPSGANWGNFFEEDVTPDNVTLAEILYVGLLSNAIIMFLIWYLDNILGVGPGVARPITFPLTKSYWVPKMSYTKGPERPPAETMNFEQEPTDLTAFIELIQATKDYNGVMAASGVNLRIFEKHITVLLGHNGAGKTTIMNMITGFIPPSFGQAIVSGYDVQQSTNNARAGMGYCNQFNILFSGMTVEEHMLFFGIMKGGSWASVRTEITNLLRDTGLLEVRSEVATYLSLGFQRRLCMALAIMGAPKVIVLDEPTAYLDPDARRDMWELLLKNRRNCAIFLTTQYLDEADILGDRIAIMVNGRIRCCGTSAFLKQRYGTGYHMQINKLPNCNVTKIQGLLSKYAPKVRLQSDSANEVVFILGQIIATRRIVVMFQDLEQRKEELGIESVGLNVMTLGDVLVRVGEADHMTRQIKLAEGGDDMDVNDKRSLVQTKTATSPPSTFYRLFALLLKRASYASRQWKVPLFSWLLPPVLFYLLLQLEFISARGGYEVATSDNRLGYTFAGIFATARAYVFQEGETEFVNDFLKPKLREGARLVQNRRMRNVSMFLLEYSWNWLRSYLFDLQVVYELHENEATLWYNGQNPHAAILVVHVFNTALLRNLTDDPSVNFNLEVVAFAPKPEDEDERQFHRTYADVVPKVLQSIFFPMISSLMCSSFVVYPVMERVLQMKHLQFMAGVTAAMYWGVNFAWDFIFFLGATVFLLPPLYITMQRISASGIIAICTLNLLHGVAALPATYLMSYLFDNPSFAFSTVTICTFIFAGLGSMCAAFAADVASAIGSRTLMMLIEVMLQLLRLLPSYSYTRGMLKTLELMSENNICYTGGPDLEQACLASAIDTELSLKRCCDAAPETRMDAIIKPMSPHPYSAFYEICTLATEGVILFVVLVFIESQWMRNFRRATATKPGASSRATVYESPMQDAKQDSDVTEETKLVDALRLGACDTKAAASPTVMVVCRLLRSYGYMKPNIVLRDLSFVLRKGECFGLLGVNGAGKTTTFRILTGDILPHDGDAFIENYSVQEDTAQFQSYLGYCPQKDGLLDMLTGTETITLFCRLRGVYIAGNDFVGTLLDSFDLLDIADYLVGTYSAGSRRKLSLCLSLVGLPKILLLDEPYVGIDTAVRKRIVNYISALQKESKMSIVLSSHSMSDVEFLCNRIAILGSGKLQCLGSLPHLKEKFGNGYTITVKTYPDRIQDLYYQQDVVQAVKGYFVKAELVHSYDGLLEFRMTDTQMEWSEMFYRMARIKKSFKLQDFYITDTSLEQIYQSFTRKEAVVAGPTSVQSTTGARNVIAGL